MNYILKSSSRCIFNRSLYYLNTNKNNILSFSTSSICNAKNTNKNGKNNLKKKLTQISMSSFISLAHLSDRLAIPYSTLIRSLRNLGFEESQLSHDYIIDNETASLVASEFGSEIINHTQEELDAKFDVQPSPQDLPNSIYKSRPPIVAIMGHVDHGKTTILDYLRKSKIVEKEFGGITQHIGAFRVVNPETANVITFLDTPGHAAFLKMRERGANITDIVVLVVAADDSVKPQTIEAIKHCKKHNANIIVAINKCDKEDANPQKVIQDLAVHEVYCELIGGETQVIEVSGKTGLNMDKLEEGIFALAEILDLKADYSPKSPVEGYIIESKIGKGVGSVSTVLITRGRLTKGKLLVAGETWCKVRELKNELGMSITSAQPSEPVEISGWKSVAKAGDLVLEVEKMPQVHQVLSYRKQRAETQKQIEELDSINDRRILHKKQVEREAKLRELLKFGLTPEDLKAKEKELLDEDEASALLKEPRCINIIVKADVAGSGEAIIESISSLGNDEVKVKILYDAVGSPTTSDIETAVGAGKTTIICFNVNVSQSLLKLASQKNVNIYECNVIYHLIEKVTKLLTDELPPKFETKVTGDGEIKSIFSITNPKNKKKFKIAGCRLNSGLLTRKLSVMVKRNGLIMFKGSLDSLKTGKDDVESVRKGLECGIQFKGWDEFQEDDVFEIFEEIEVPRYL